MTRARSIAPSLALAPIAGLMTGLVTGLVAPRVIAQPSPSGTPTAPKPADQPASPDDAAKAASEKTLTAGLLLGQRASTIRSQIPVAPVLVVVPDAASFIEAISRWTPRLQFPVLIDDGTRATREDIARFVRGFKPTRVVRWNASDDARSEASKSEPAKSETSKGSPAPLPAGEPERHPKILADLVDRAVSRAWGLAADSSKVTELVAHLKGMNLVPPGIVVCNPEDPAWTAGLALAAARGQPIAWARAPQGAGNTMSQAQTEKLIADIEAACDATGLTWRSLGDDIDAVSLCMNVPAKFTRGQAPKPVMTATTDAVGRLPFAEGNDDPARWAWSSSIWGSNARAAYSAMSSLFIAPESSWIFDGYPDSGNWTLFDGTAAGERLAAVEGFTTVIDDTPKQSARDWRSRASSSVRGSLVMVTSKGNGDFFDAEPGRLRPGDIPVLEIPSAVYFVHSWSATSVTWKESVAGTWFERGAFAYFGSVEEPYLQSFVPTPIAAARLAARFPWAAATRLESRPLWKLACFGDPLWTISPASPRSDAEIPINGSATLDDAMREALKGGRLAEAAGLLVMLGRDADAARLFDATRREKPSGVTAEFAAICLPAAFRAGRADLVIACAERLGPASPVPTDLADIVWLAARKELAEKPDASLLDVMERAVRKHIEAEDRAEINQARARLGGK